MEDTHALSFVRSLAIDEKQVKKKSIQIALSFNVCANNIIRVPEE